MSNEELFFGLTQGLRKFPKESGELMSFFSVENSISSSGCATLQIIGKMVAGVTTSIILLCLR